ncbi:TfoX/Sxy family protein [Comamonas sp. GB3 AK4-5]|uniref:TfoX/Sxy family protein n=1 Tax=Comamonas sp. GB3 AK4-5 TaxID=3231487 RepID=UPI00351EF211
MPAKPLSDEALRLIDAVREALAEHGAEVEEKRMFGCHVFMVNGKLCLGVEDDELLVRLPPSTHAAVAETPGVRTLSSKGLMDGYFYIGPSAYATQAQWQHWVGAALAFNPLAKATPKKSRKPAGVEGKDDAARSAKKSSPSLSSLRKSTKTAAKNEGTARKHSVFDDDDL